MADPKKGTGKKPKGSGRRLYTDENPRDRVKIKFATPADARATVAKVKPGSKAAKRRKSYCARSLGQLKRASAKTRNDPNSRIRQARRRWKC